MGSEFGKDSLNDDQGILLYFDPEIQSFLSSTWNTFGTIVHFMISRHIFVVNNGVVGPRTVSF